MDITTKTLEELKVMAYDQLVVLEQTQNNLKVINQEIAKRQVKEEVKEEVKDK